MRGRLIAAWRQQPAQALKGACLAGFVSVLPGCTPPPPALVAVPGATRTAQDFAQDDSFCRRHSSFGSAEAANGTGQGQPVDYLQCMAARGDIITEARSPAITVTYLSYPTTDPWPYFDWGWWLGFGPAWGGPDPRGRPEAGPVGRPAIGGSPFPPGGD